MAAPRFTLEFYKDATGRKPVLEWLRNKASVSTRRVVGTALREILQEQGMGVCGTAFGRQLGGGLFEFRLREGDLLLRAFCHAFGDKVIVLLAAYDKSEDPSAKRQRKVPVRQAATCKLDLFSLARDAATCRRASAVRSG